MGLVASSERSRLCRATLLFVGTTTKVTSYTAHLPVSETSTLEVLHSDLTVKVERDLLGNAGTEQTVRPPGARSKRSSCVPPPMSPCQPAGSGTSTA